MGLGFFIWQRAWESNPLYHKGIHAFQACALPSGPLSIWWKVLESNQRRPLDLYGLANRCIAALPTFQAGCATMRELRTKMAEKYGKVPIQLTLFVPSQNNGAFPGNQK